MNCTDVAVIGAGPAGLAMSACLSRQGTTHVVFERGNVAERWRQGSWDSLRLLTPNWLSRLPEWHYAGNDPRGYMSHKELIEHLSAYAAHSQAPVQTGSDVRTVDRMGGRYRVVTSKGIWQARSIVIATGQCGFPRIPALAQALSPDIDQLTPATYKRPGALRPGGVLVVGASASGVQIAEEVRRSGRSVTLSVGSHTRLPRHYRGHDIMWWLDRLGILHESADSKPDLASLRRQPSLQLIGRRHGPIDLASLREMGVEIRGRARGAYGTRIVFAGDLSETTATAERKLVRLLDRIDAAADEFSVPVAGRPRREAVILDDAAGQIDLAKAGIQTVIWATGYQPRYPWLHVPVLDASGWIEHNKGSTASPGLYVLGLRWLRRRSSSFIDGIGRDSTELAGDIARFLGQVRHCAA